MSAIGTKRTYLVAPHMSAFGGKADMHCKCLLLTQSGHCYRIAKCRPMIITRLVNLSVACSENRSGSRLA